MRGLTKELLAKSPVEVFDHLRRLRESGRPVAPPGPFRIVCFDGVAHRLGAERLPYLVEHASSMLSEGLRSRRWFLRLDAASRTAVVETWSREGHCAWGGFLLSHLAGANPRQVELAYRRWSAQSQDSHGVIPIERLKLLPTEFRIREAERHLDRVSYLETRASERVAYTAPLPFEAARKTASALLGHPEGEMRAVALRAILGALEHDSSAIEPGLLLVLAREYEQDPVRLASSPQREGNQEAPQDPPPASHE